MGNQWVLEIITGIQLMVTGSEQRTTSGATKGISTQGLTSLSLYSSSHGYKKASDKNRTRHENLIKTFER